MVARLPGTLLLSGFLCLTAAVRANVDDAHSKGDGPFSHSNLIPGGPQAAQAQTPAPAEPTRADILRGGYSRYRANNDLLSYDLRIRVDPEKKSISGTNTIRFRMLADDTRIQIDLTDKLDVRRITFAGKELKYERELGAVFIDFPETLKKARTYEIEFEYAGQPQETGRFGGIAFRKDPAGRPWINTACQHSGSSVWWPSKDQYRDEVESMRLSVEVPSDLVDVSNGKFLGKHDLGDGYTRYDWLIQYPINSYCVSLNIGNYVHFADAVGATKMDFYCLPENLDKAKQQFAQAKLMIQAFEKYFGEYPFRKDGYKLIEAPYSGMEHQSAVTYGNHFANGYLERDWTGVGISLKFDFIIIHESAHEWWGNSVTAADVCDEWIHEGWGTYAEAVYVEYLFGKDDALKYVNGYRTKVRNREPIIPPCAVNRTPPQDMYFKGALFLNTLRSVVDDDRKWWKLVRDTYQQFRYQDITTEDMVRFFNRQTGRDLGPVFDQYLRHTQIPTLELQFHGDGTVAYRWKVDVAGFTMPIKVRAAGNWQTIQPTTTWRMMKAGVAAEQFEVATDLYYVNVVRGQS